MTKRGLFITVEGGEGVGKTTNMAFLQQCLEENDIPFITSREPGGTPLAEKIRLLLLDRENSQFDSVAELLLVFAARAQHISEVIRPALNAGTWVLCDRFTDATYAYQGGGRELSTDLIEELENIVQQGLQPDATILLDVPPEVGLDRARQRADLDRFEIEPQSFFERVREAYLERARQDPRRFHVVDASQALDRVQQELANIVKLQLEKL